MNTTSTLILALDSSAKSASVAVGELLPGGRASVLAEMNSNRKITHSQTLLPMVQSLLSCTGMALADIGAFAVSTGPGSFTGLRIGIGAVKGLSYSLDRPCVGVSTLDAIARGLPGVDGVICAAMDARCNQAYTALFDSTPGGLTRRTEDMALTLDELAEKLKNEQKNIFFVGDGAELCYNTFKTHLPHCWLAAENARYQRASGVLLAAAERLERGEICSAAALSPKYLRLPQAERERLRQQAESPAKRD